MAEKKASFSLDWRVVFGLTVTSCWIGAGMAYLFFIVGGGSFVHLPIADIGNFLEGAFAPLAFLWLVIGHFMQQKEISANTRAMASQEESARRQEMHARRDSYFKLLELIQGQLGSIAGFQYMSVCGPTGTGEITSEEFTEQRAIANSGDSAWFVRKMLSLALHHRDDPDMVREIFYGTAIRTRHSENFRQTFSKILRAAESVDMDDMVTNALLYGSPSGMLYRVIQHIRGEELMDPLNVSTPPGTVAEPERQN
jgi:hypothetical protein